MNERFFQDCLSKCKYAIQVKRDVKNALSSYTDLQPKVEAFMFNDGTSQDLVCLEGTIPVRYRSSTYNIPIAIFLYQTHPHTAPMVFVRPTSTMRIKLSDFVDVTGNVTLPYITEWKYPGSDLIGLLSVLQVVFGERPPVFAKVSTTHGQKAMPILPSIGFFSPPSTTLGSNMPMMPPGSGWPTPPNPQMKAYGNMQPAPPPIPSYHAPYLDFPTPSVPILSSMQTAAPGQINPYTITPTSEDHIHTSLRSAVLDRIRRVQNEILCQHGDEVSAIKQSQSDLVCGGQKLREMMRRMEFEQAETDKAVNLLKLKNKELSDLLERLKEDSHEPINVDEAVDTTLPLYRQLLSTFAEEQAIEDAIYYSAKSLENRVVDLEVFLKKVRILSRKQFMLRAIVQQCREKAGLPV